MKSTYLSNKSRPNSKYIFDLDLTLYSENDFKDTENEKEYYEKIYP